MISFTVKQFEDGSRLDKFLCKKFDISFSLAQKVIRQKKVKVNSKRVEYSYKIKHSDEVEIFGDLNIRRQKERANISDGMVDRFFKKAIYEDRNLIALDKISGLAVQGGSGVKVSVDDYLFGKEWQLVHRLDKDTSGILLIAKNKETAEMLTDKFRKREIKKTYIALIMGNLKKESGEISIPLKKKFINKNEKVRPDYEDGKEAITNYKLIENFQNYASVELSPVTGRTHQLRVHMKEIGHPIVNDIKYGTGKASRKDLCKRLCLHAYKIRIDDYFGKKLEIESKRPEFY